MTTKFVRSSFVKEVGNLETFGRPSAMSQEKQRESSLMIDASSPMKNSERLDTQTNDQTSIRKHGKKKKMKTIPKPDTSSNIVKRPRKTFKSKKRQSESTKMLSMGCNTGPGSLTGSKRCSTSHFGA